MKPRRRQSEIEADAVEVRHRLFDVGTPEDLRSLLGDRGRTEIDRLVHAAGPEQVAKRAMEILVERFEGGDDDVGVVRWSIKTSRDVLNLDITLNGADGARFGGNAETAEPRVTILIGIADLLLLLGGRVNLFKSLALRRMQLSGDYKLASRLPALFGATSDEADSKA